MNNILLGKQEPETWYAILDEWYEWGGRDYIQEMNDYIEALQ